MNKRNKYKVDLETPFNCDEYMEEFEFWLGCGKGFVLLAEEYEERNSRKWRLIAISHGWYGEAVRRLRERYERIKEAVETENVDRARGLIGVAYAALESAFIRDENGNIVDTNFDISSAADFDRVARLILLLQGDADSRSEISNFAEFMNALGDAATDDEKEVPD